MRCLGITNVMARSIPDPFPLHPQGKKSADRAGSALPVLERQRNQPDIPDVARPPVFREIKAVLARDSSSVTPLPDRRGGSRAFGLAFRSSIRRLLKSQQSKSNDRQLFGLSEFLGKIDTAGTSLKCSQSDSPEVF